MTRYGARAASAISNGWWINSSQRRRSITIALAARLLGVTHATASGYIRRLVRVGVLREWTGRRRDQVFVAREIRGFMQERAEA